MLTMTERLMRKNCCGEMDSNEVMLSRGYDSLADMHYCVFSGGLNGRDLVQLHKGNLPRDFDSQSSELTPKAPRRRLIKSARSPRAANADFFCWQ